MEYTPKNWQDVLAILSVIGILVALLRWMMNDLLARIQLKVEQLEVEMSKAENRFASKETMNLQFEELRREQRRTNEVMDSLRDELKTSIHTVANSVDTLKEILIKKG